MNKLFKAALFSVLFSGPLAAQQAALWVPADSSGAEEVLSAMEHDGALKLTAALPPLPAALEKRAEKLEASGQLEIAMRPAGDPPMPLLYYPSSPQVAWSGKVSTAPMGTDQYFLALRLTLARDAALKTLKETPAGLVGLPGGLVADYFPLSRALGVKWLATGPIPSTAAAVFTADEVYAVPFTDFSTAAVSLQTPSFVMFDETSAPDPAALRAAMLAELKASKPQKNATVSEALKTAVPAASTRAGISAEARPWTGDYTPWASAPLQAGALAALAQTRADLMLYLNSLQGNYIKASPAFEEYFSAEDGGKLRALASADAGTSGETEIEIRNSLVNTYRLMKKDPPPWAFSSLADALSEGSQAEKIQVLTLPDGFELKNVSRPPLPPESTPGLPPGTDPARIWKLAGLKVESVPGAVLFKFQPLALDNSLKKPAGFSHINLDLYIDINHRPRAGMTRPLEGRPLRLFPENAWEYAIELDPDGATLYKITPKGPVAAGSLKVSTGDGVITVNVPAERLRGNPELWSYAALLLAPAANGEFAIADYLADQVTNGYIYAVRPGKD